LKEVRSKTDGLQHRNQVAQSAARFERIRLLIAGAEPGVAREDRQLRPAIVHDVVRQVSSIT